MRRLLAAVAFLWFFVAHFVWAPDACAHGGVYNGPGGRVPPGIRSPLCGCASPECPMCSPPGFVAGEHLAKREQETLAVHRWLDLALVRRTVRFRSKDAERPVEGYAAVEVAPLFAVSSARIGAGTDALLAVSVGPEAANAPYLRARDRDLDPLLLTRFRPGSLHLRAYPVSAAEDTVVTIEGYTLRPATFPYTRLYRTGDRYLAIVPFEEGAPPSGAPFVDHVGRRALYFLDRETTTRRFPSLVALAREVPCVPALERAVESKERETWVALPGGVGTGAPASATLPGPGSPEPASGSATDVERPERGSPPEAPSAP